MLYINWVIWTFIVIATYQLTGFSLQFTALCERNYLCSTSCIQIIYQIELKSELNWSASLWSKSWHLCQYPTLISTLIQDTVMCHFMCHFMSHASCFARKQRLYIHIADLRAEFRFITQNWFFVGVHIVGFKCGLCQILYSRKNDKETSWSTLSYGSKHGGQ